MNSAFGALKTAAWCVSFICAFSTSAHPQTCADYADCLPILGSTPVQWGAKGVAVAGDYAYVATPSALVILNITDASHPTIVSTLDINTYPSDLVVQNGYVYLIANGGFHVIDVSNPSAPVITGNIFLPNAIGYGVAVSGQIAYIASGPPDEFGGYLSAVDVSNPSNPHFLSTEVTSGSARDIVLSGNYAYVADSGSGLVVMSIMPPGNVDIVAYLFLNGTHRGVAVSGTHAYLASGEQVHVIDISDPLHPTRITGINTPASSTDVVAQGTRLYVADSHGMNVIDISDPVNPALMGSTEGLCKGVAVAGSLAYLVAEQNFAQHFRVVDVSHPEVCAQTIGALDTPEALTVVVNDDRYAYVADYWEGLHIIDITDPSDPSLVVSWAPAPTLDLAVIGSLAYASCGIYGLYVIDISNPALPHVVGHADTPGAARGIAVAGRYAYIADDASGLQVIDVLNPASPIVVGSIETGGEARAVAIDGNYAYVGERTGFKVVDISNPQSPAIAASLSASAYDVAIDEGYAYLAAATIGLQIVDISNPELPSITGTAAVSGFAYGVATDGAGHVYLANYQNGMHVLDVSDPATPHLLGGIDTPDRAMGVTVRGNYAFVADSISGLLIYPAQCGAAASVPSATSPIGILSLHEPTPNPFTSSTRLSFELREPATVDARVHDVGGRLVRRLVESRTVDRSGSEQLSWDGRDDRGRALPGGVYFLTLNAGEWTATRRIVIVR